MAWSHTEMGSIAEYKNQIIAHEDLTDIPDLPAGKATFAILSKNPEPAAVAAIQSLHDLYNNERDRLLTAFQGREATRIAREAELKAHPPKPKDIVLNHWRVGTPVPQKGDAR